MMVLGGLGQVYGSAPSESAFYGNALYGTSLYGRRKLRKRKLRTRKMRKRISRKIRLDLEDIFNQILVNLRESEDLPISSRERTLLSENEVKQFLVERATEVDTECVICLEVKANP